MLGYVLAGVIVGPHIPIPLFVDAERIHTLSELGVIDDVRRVGTEGQVPLEVQFTGRVAGRDRGRRRDDVVRQGTRSRKESRGGHAREDYQSRDDVNFMRHTMAYRERDSEGRSYVRLDYKPVTMTRYQPMERKY